MWGDKGAGDLLCDQHSLVWLTVAQRVGEEQVIPGQFLRVLIPVVVLKVFWPRVVALDILHVGYFVILPEQNLLGKIQLITALGLVVFLNQKHLR